MKRLLFVAGLLLLPSAARADSLSFLRVDQTGLFRSYELAMSYGIEGAQSLRTVSGASAPNVYRGITHRFAAGFAIQEWLVLGVDMSARQNGLDFAAGMLAPEVRLGLGVFGVEALRRSGLAVYSQARFRITGRRPSGLVAGIAFSRSFGPVVLGARVGYESTPGAIDPEYGLRYEAGGSVLFAGRWRAGLEAWGAVAWTRNGRESDHHAGPALQVDLRPVRIGLVIAVGARDRPGSLEIDTMGMLRLAVRL